MIMIIWETKRAGKGEVFSSQKSSHFARLNLIIILVIILISFSLSSFLNSERLQFLINPTLLWIDLRKWRRGIFRGRGMVGGVRNKKGLVATEPGLLANCSQ